MPRVALIGRVTYRSELQEGLRRIGLRVLPKAQLHRAMTVNMGLIWMKACVHAALSCMRACFVYGPELYKGLRFMRPELHGSVRSTRAWFA